MWQVNSLLLKVKGPLACSAYYGDVWPFNTRLPCYLGSNIYFGTTSVAMYSVGYADLRYSSPGFVVLGA